MTFQVSVNVRYLLWRAGIPRGQWQQWLALRASLQPQTIKGLVSASLADADVSDTDLQELARAFDVEDEGKNLRFEDLPHDRSDVLLENLKFLVGTLEHGGKKQLAARLQVDPTTVSRWLNGASEPQGTSLQEIVVHFGLPMSTNLRETPVFLSPVPVAVTERRGWVLERMGALSIDEFRDLYPALRRMLEPR